MFEHILKSLCKIMEVASWLAELALDPEVLGSIPDHSNLFQENMPF